jgi:hypothetical protein
LALTGPVSAMSRLDVFAGLPPIAGLNRKMMRQRFATTGR